MDHIRCRMAFSAFALVVLTVASGAQQRPLSPHIGYCYPAGGKQGATLEVTVGGQMLSGAKAVRISGVGVQATVAGYDRPLNVREVLLLRDRLEEARKKLQGPDAEGKPRLGLNNPFMLVQLAKEAGITSEELRKLAEFQRNQADPKRQLNPQLEEKVNLEIKIAPDASPGMHELRLVTSTGVTNPLRFEVGRIAECRESEPNDRSPDTAIGDTMPIVINGQILPGDVDRFSFTAHKGMRLVAAVHARELIPYLADTVPGWFQPAITIYDANAHEIAYADHYRFHPDPVLFCVIPADGSYVLEIRDTLYRGREDFVYRVTLGEVPFVTSVFPLGGRADAPTTVEVKGWNLPQRRVTLLPTEPKPQQVSISGQNGISNSVPFATDMLPERMEKEPNEDKAHAQGVTLPIIVNGRIDEPGDVDVFRFEGRAGNQIVAEVTARRLDSPLDSVLELFDAHGRQIAMNDDFVNPGAGLETHHADSRIVTTLPATGAYYLRLRDAQQNGGEEYAYRLRISAPRPDFELRVVPSSFTARAGMSVPITVYALRQDGFAGEIALNLKDTSSGFTLSGGSVPAGQDSVRFTLTAPSSGTVEPLLLQMDGTANVDGRKISHAVVPAEDMTQAFAYHHLVPAEEWLVTVIGRINFGPQVKRVEETPVKITPGGTTGVALTGQAALRFQYTLSDPPAGISIQGVLREGTGLVLVLRADASKVKPGLKGNLVVEALTEYTPPAVQGKPATGKRRVSAGFLPAIPFEVIPP